MSKPKRAEQENGKAVAATAPPESLQAGAPPEPMELAMVAALLQRDQAFDPSKLASQALDIWEACAEEVTKRREPRRRPIDQLRAALPRPKAFPVPLETFLDLMLPKRREPDRQRVYRHFLMDWRTLDQAKAADLLAQHKEQPADRLDYFERAYVFKKWIEVDLSCGKRLNGLKGRRSLSQSEVETEKKKASEERRKAVVAAHDHWHKVSRASRVPMLV